MAMGLGLLQYKSASDLHAEDQAARQESDLARQTALVESSLASHIRRCFSDAKVAKEPIERRLLDCQRRHKGVYDDDKLRTIAEEGGTTIYPKITTTKTRAAAAWIRDVLMPALGRPWGLDPTPVADIPPALVQAFVLKMQAEEDEKFQKMQAAQAAQAQPQEGVDPQQGQQIPSPGQPQLPVAGNGSLVANPTQIDEEAAIAKIRALVQEKARQVADRHEKVIDDQLTEGGWYECLEEFIDDFCIFPAAFIRGPMLQKVTELAWQDGWQPTEVEAIKPMFDRVSPFDIYPSPDATDVDNGSYIMERERYTRASLNRLRGVPGYKTEAVEAVLEAYGRGGLRDWLASDNERARLEDKQSEWLNNSGQTIEGIHYWGGAQGLMLLQWGLSAEQITDPLGEYEIDAILIGQHVIRCVINKNPMGSRPYHKASFQLIPGSFWGMSIPELMADIQDVCCATARAQINNMAFSSGPQFVVATDRLARDENPNEIYPYKRWKVQTDRSGTGSTRPVVEFFQPQSNAGELMGVYDKWESRSDDATGIPRYAYGNAQAGGAGSTMGGLSMLFESANKGIKDAIRHIDRGVTRRVIYSLWLHNMKYSDDVSIKGDCKVIPKGATAQLLRDQTQQARQQFLVGTANDLDMQIIGMEGRARLLRSVAESLDLPGLIPDEDALKAKMAEQQEQQAKDAEAQGQAQQAQMQAQAQKSQAESEVKTASAEKIQAETQQILLQIQGMVAQLSQLGVMPNAGLNPGADQGLGAPGVQQQPGMAGIQEPAQQYA
jgi:hypothetical protein